MYTMLAECEFQQEMTRNSRIKGHHWFPEIVTWFPENVTWFYDGYKLSEKNDPVFQNRDPVS